MEKIKLNVGCGTDIKTGWVNLDSHKLPGVDIVHDIEKMPWPFASGSVSHVFCANVLEHVDYIPVMKEIHRILCEDGTVEIIVPHFTSRNNFIDPTHRKMFSIRTFEFFVKDSSYGRGYYFDFMFRKIERRKIMFEKRASLFFNYLVEPVMNISSASMIYYEATFLSRLFPAADIFVALRK